MELHLYDVSIATSSPAYVPAGSEGERVEIERTNLLFLGTPPNLILSIWRWDTEARRHLPVDRLTSCKVTGDGVGKMIIGVSEYLHKTVGVSSDAAVCYVEVTNLRGCKSCRQ